MERIYSIQDAKNKMEKSAKYYEVRIKAWENVKRLYKKDGGEFANLGKNFDGAKIIKKYYSDDLYIQVCFQDENGAWNTDDIRLCENMYEAAADTAEKVQAKINALLEKYKKYLETDKKGAQEIENQIKNIVPHLDALKKAIDEAGTTNTNYTLQGYIIQYLKIL